MSEKIKMNESLKRDLDLFLDMDLSILGDSPHVYEIYR